MTRLLVVAGVVAAAVASAQQAPARRFMPSGMASSFSVLRSDAALNELKVTEEQRTRIQALVKTVGDEILNSRSVHLLGGQDTTPEQRAERTAKSRQADAAIVRRHESEVKDVLNADQYRRLGEIVLQAKGAQALLEEELAAALALTDDQKAKLAEIDNGVRIEIRTLPRSNNREEAQEKANKMRDMAKRRDDAMLAVLSPDQAKQLEQAKGRAFDLDSLQSGSESAAPTAK